MPTLAQNEMDTLEQMIDVYDLATVIEALADICSEKADHVWSSWQDKATAYVWEQHAERLYRVRNTLEPTS